MTPRRAFGGKVARAAALVLVVAAAFYGFGRLTGGPAAPRPALFVEGRYLDFGEHEVAKDFVWRLPIQNTTAEPIEVLALKASCGCTKVAPQAFSVAPGETAEISLTLDLAPTKEADLAAEFTNFSVDLTPQLRLPPAEPLSFRLTGRVLSPYQLEPAYLSFGNDCVAGEPPPTRTVRVRSRRPAEKLAAVCERGTASVQLERREDGYLLSITPRADLPTGKHEFAITLSGSAADGKPLPEGRLPAVVQVLAPVAATPAFVPLGLVTLGGSATREVELHARSGRGFEVVEIRAPQESGLSARPAAHANRYTLEQRAVAAGHHRGVVTFVVRVEGSQEPVEVPVKVAYQAAEPAVAAATNPEVAP